MGIERAEVIARMRGAFRKGISANRFVSDMKAVGLSYRRADMLADYRNIGQYETKKDLFKYVRKDYYPTAAVMAQTTDKLKKEFMYVMRIRKRLSPDAPVTERRVNIVSDIPMTPCMVEQAVVEKWAEWEKYTPEIIEEIIPFMAVHRSGVWQV